MPQKKELGQYFTISEQLQQFVFDKVKYKGAPLLEPSFGAGHLLKKFKDLDSNYPMTCYELDASIRPVVSFNAHQAIIYGDFTKQKISTKFKTIIGNPPYVKQARGANLYIKFIELCYELLDTDGELLFIVPSDFIKLTSAAEILMRMTESGSFTDFLFPNNEKLFEGASIDVLIFRYQKGLITKKALVDGKEKFCTVRKGIVTFSDTEPRGSSLESLFHVYVGLVSGRDEIYKQPFGNIDLLCDKGRLEKFLFPEVFPTKNAQMDAHLLANKAELLRRKIRKFSESNWFEWGAPRNLTSIRSHWGKPCIYVRNMTRKSDVAFLGSVQYFGGTLLCLVPKTTLTAAAFEKTVQYLNSEAFQKDYIYSGRFKIGHKQISTALLPPM